MSVKNIKQIILKRLPNVKFNVLLNQYTTFRIGGSAKYFIEVKDVKEIINTVLVAKKLHLPFFVLGAGSNILFSDKGFNGLIIKIKGQGLKVLRNKIISSAGVTLSKLTGESIKQGLSGLEWFIGIPGTLGGAIWANSGAFGKSISDAIETVEVLDIKTLKIKKLSVRQCRFNYKDSIFKTNANLIILSATLFCKKSSLQKIRQAVVGMQVKRKASQPLNYPSAGCVFQNVTKQIRNKKLIKGYPELAKFNQKNVIPAGYLIEKCGLKGKQVGDAKISELHANFIINLNKAKARDVLKLINLAKSSVKKKFGVKLKEEIKIVV